MTELELLAPARNADIGIAAIDCGADAVYMAGPSFGARKDAGNSMEDIARVCAHASHYGARVFVTINTILTDDETAAAETLIDRVIEAGADAIIVQDMAVTALAGGRIPLHASTQCAISDPDKAAWLASKGFARLILEREMSLEQIRTIHDAAPEAELEFFVHGALCVCYSGQCYLSEHISGRSANRGACIQACRSRYDLVDGSGKTIVRDKALLSLKDYNLLGRLGDLADAGVSSFKIEGRLKNESYVRNVVRTYSEALDALVASRPGQLRRASYGHVTKAFTPAIDKTFNRGYTELFIDGMRGSWAAMDAAKGMGEECGKVRRISADRKKIEIDTGRKDIRFSNGDGFAFIDRKGDVVGFRGDVCNGTTIQCKGVEGLFPGATVFRNLDAAFEKEIASHPGTRVLDAGIMVSVKDGLLTARAHTEDGREAIQTLDVSTAERATDEARMKNVILSQLGKSAGLFRFSARLGGMDRVPMLSSASLNSLRRSLSEKLEKMPCGKIKTAEGKSRNFKIFNSELSYKANISNKIAEGFYRDSGATSIEPAYELTHRAGAELMRSRYCIRHELGICLKDRDCAVKGPLFLVNNGRRLALGFDCANCEMTVKEA